MYATTEPPKPVSCAMLNIEKALGEVSLADFRAYFYILEYDGNRQLAAEELEIPVEQLNEMVESWAGRGTDYRRMYSILQEQVQSNGKCQGG